jgi:hypothetical protein
MDHGDRAAELGRKVAFDMEQAPEPEPEPVVVAFPAVPAPAPRIAGGDLAALVGGRLRFLRAVCVAMLAGVALLAAASVIVVRLGVVRPVASTGLSLTLTLLAAVLILAASRVQSALLARVGRGTIERGPAAAGLMVTGGVPPLRPAAPAVAAELVGAYARATIAGFASLAAAATLGLVVALVTAVPRYALVICGVAALGMLARWPRRAAAVRLLRQRGLA